MNLIKRRVAITLTALLTSITVQAQTALDDILSSKLLKVAVPTDSAPYGYVGTDLKPIGLDIDMAYLIGKKLGVPVELVVVTSANRIPALQTKKADLVISTLGKNAEREKVIDFTAAYSPFFQAVFGAKTANAKSFADLAGKTVGVTRGAMEDQELGKVAPANTDTKRFEDNNATIAAFTAGKWLGRPLGDLPQ
jgi:polar amino acid transport system substrate-binding protein